MKRNYKIIERDSNCKVIENCSTLAEVQKELNLTKKLIKKGETLYSSLEKFMNLDILVIDENNTTRQYVFKGNKRIY